MIPDSYRLRKTSTTRGRPGVTNQQRGMGRRDQTIMCPTLLPEASLADKFRVGDWMVSPELNRLERNGQIVHLEPKIMRVLLTLIERSGEVVLKEQIFHRVWPETFVSDEVLTRSVSELRKVFEDNPREPTYIQTIPKGGYRLLAPVVTLTADRTDARRGRWWKEKSWVLAGGAAIALLGASFYFLIGRERRAFRPRITSLAVLPLTNLSGDADQDYFAEGMTDELTTRLSKISALRVISRTSVMHYQGGKKTIPEIARELQVDAVVEGSVLRSGDKVRISAQLIEADNDQHMWAESYERDLRDVLALQADVASTIAEQIKIQVTPREHDKLTAAVTVNPQAHDSYLKGLYYWDKFTEEGMEKAVASFEEAIQLDPSYAPAYAGLAHAYHELAYFGESKEVMPKAKEAAIRALQLDATNAEAHAALGWVKWHYDWDWTGAEQEYRRALEIDPNNGQAHGQYADYLDDLGRFQQALQEHDAALRLNPLWLIGRSNLGDSYFMAGRYAEAVEQYKKVLDLEPNFTFARVDLGLTYAEQGKFQDAIAQLQKAYELDHGTYVTLAYVYARSGNRNEAANILTHVLDSSKQHYVSPVDIAFVYLALGQQHQACKWLERAYNARDSGLVDRIVGPYFAGLRSNPCFQDLMRRVGFPQPTFGPTPSR